MAIVFLDQGEAALLSGTWSLGVTSTLKLYTNNVTSSLTAAQIDALDETDFTEATFTGYSAATLTGGSWTVTGGNPTSAVYAQQTFTSSADQTAQDVYGYFVVRASDGAAIYFEQFTDGPYTVEFNADNIKVTPRITLDDTGGDEMPTGAITAWSTNTAPSGYLLCDGSAVSRTTYATLFGVIGTTYGVGDGSTTFNVPDLRQRFILGRAASGTGSTLAGTGGAIDHVHGLGSSTAIAQINIIGSTGQIQQRKSASMTSWTETVQTTHTASANTSAAGGSDRGTHLQGDTLGANPPFMALTYIVKV